MKEFIGKITQKKAAMLVLALPLVYGNGPAVAMERVVNTAETSLTQQQNVKIVNAYKLNPTTIEVTLSNNQRMTFDFYGENIFRIFQDNNGGIIRDPEAKPEAKILVENPRKCVSKLNLNDNGSTVTITTGKISIQLDKNTTLLKVTDLTKNKVVIEEVAPIKFEEHKVAMTLKANPDEYFYGGGVQNGRFSHKGKVIAIENTNSWTDGGVASPTPFYWSTAGYGMMWYTFKQGEYDFGSKEKNEVNLSHQTNYLDVFYMVSETPVALLNDFYQLTGNPVLLPKFGFYQGHLNAYNRDYWKETDKGGVPFEDGKNYQESQKDNGGIKESLNGEKNNYQFSARGVIDRYKKHDMPLGWVLPNDGYGAGYGQTETLDGNIANLKSFGEYARKNGVEIGLWTQSDLHPKEGVSALLQRDIVKEVRDAGVRVLKTDVAWVGAGYSFGLNGVADVGHIMPYYGNDARPFIISLDGWAGTQRYAGIWSGDQTGGKWEYIRFHIPTFIGSGLSGQPNITNDMDGIFGGKNLVINTRDFQWKTFTPMELNMDGWGSNEKYPHALGEPATSINRWYLKLKSELMPYTYSIAKEAVDGKPMIRAMFLDYPNEYTLGTATRYQFLYGPSFIVAPIYQETKVDKEGNDIRNGIYLPEGTWYDYFSGEKYEGNRIISNFNSPLWKLPVFVKAGAIIPMTNPNNNVSEIKKDLRIYEIYPAGNTSFTEYDDDGVTEAYRLNKHTTTLIESGVQKSNVTVTIHPTKGNFDGFVKEKTTQFVVNVTAKPKKVAAKIGKKSIKLNEVNSMNEFNNSNNVYYYDAAPNLNKFATPGSEFAKEVITKNPQLLVKVAPADITANVTILNIAGFEFNPQDKQAVSTGKLDAPKAQITAEHTGPYTLTPSWNKVNNADYYEIDFNGMLYSTIKDNQLLFEDLKAETPYSFKIRAVNKEGHSDWAEAKATTKANPLEFAIQGVTAETTCKNQGGQGANKLFDFDESSIWHTIYGEKSIPFELIADMHSVNQLDKFQYIPREDAGNGTILKATISYSMDKNSWTEAGNIEWARDGKVKEFKFNGHPTARYIKLAVTEAVGNYGSGQELYIFKVPGTESYIPGDINHDKLLDMNDITSYMNYTGLRKGDSDYEGYISKGDLNQNGLIDAYDISVVGTQIRGGVDNNKTDKVEGKITISTSKQTYNAGETIEIHVKGTSLKAVNALSFGMPYNPQDYEYEGITLINMNDMENMTYDRLHTNGVKALYPTFVNLGNKDVIEGTKELFIIKMKAKRKVKFDLKAIDGILVDKNLNTLKF